MIENTGIIRILLPGNIWEDNAIKIIINFSEKESISRLLNLLIDYRLIEIIKINVTHINLN